MRSIFFLLLVMLSSPLQSATNTVLGTTDAMRCFQQSQLVLDTQGIGDCDRAIESGDLTRRDLAATYSNRGLIYARNGELEQALADHNRAIELVPTLGQAYINRGNAYHHMHRYEDALADYKKAIALETAPRHIPWYNSGLTLLKLKRFDEALDAFRKALEFAPDSKKIRERIEFLENRDEKTGDDKQGPE